MLKVILPSKRKFTEGDISSVKEILSLVKEILFLIDCKEWKLLHKNPKSDALNKNLQEEEPMTILCRRKYKVVIRSPLTNNLIFSICKQKHEIGKL